MDRDRAVGVERTFEPWTRAHFVDEVLPKLDDIVDQLRVGTTAADIGCGTGAVVIELASAFPQSTVLGFEISEHALDRARTRLAESGVGAEFRNARDSPIPQNHSLGFVTTFDCIHDMTDPAAMIAAIFRSLASDGTWLLVDIKAYDTFAENVAHNPMAAMMYGAVSSAACHRRCPRSAVPGSGRSACPSARQRSSPPLPGSLLSQGGDRSLLNAFYEIRP